MPWVAEQAPEGWKDYHPTSPTSEELVFQALPESEEEVEINARKRAWVRLLAKVYEVDPFVCPKCGAEMKPNFPAKLYLHRRRDAESLIDLPLSLGHRKQDPAAVDHLGTQLLHRPDHFLHRHGLVELLLQHHPMNV